MNVIETGLTARLAVQPDEVRAAQRLRYDVFVAELGASGAMVDHEHRLERDAFDAVAEHLILEDATRPGEVVGAYRLIHSEAAEKLGGYYSDTEYDLEPLKSSGRRLLELGRSCLHPDYRGGGAILKMWEGLAAYVVERRIEVLFGVASFHGTDVTLFEEALSYLHERFLAPPHLRVNAKGSGYQKMNLIPPDQINRAAAMRATPALIKAYLRLGGTVGEGAYIDKEFNTIDVCLVMDTAQLSATARKRYVGTEA